MMPLLDKNHKKRVIEFGTMGFGMNSLASIKVSRLILLASSIFFSLFACQKTTSPSNQPSTGKTNLKAATNTKSKSQTDEKQTKLNPIWPFDASVSFKSKVKVKDSDFMEGYQAPQLELNLTNADYVQILRCADSYHLSTATGKTVDEVRFATDAQGQLASAWNTALNANHYCKIVTTNAAFSSFSDLAANSGSFYYVLNPCISKNRSKSYRDGCSYDLKISDTIYDYTNQLKEDVIQAVNEVNAKQADLFADLVEVNNLIIRFTDALEACENKVASDSALAQFKYGLLTFGVTIAGFAFGVYNPISAIRGWNSAQMIATMGGMVGSMQLNDAFFKLPPDVVNECNDPNVVATTAEEREAAKAKGKSMVDGHMGQNTGKYQEIFGVNDLRNKLAELLKQGGPIDNKRTALAEAQQKLAAIQKGVITYDQALSQMANQGFDLTNFKDLVKILPDALKNKLPADPSQ